ncbi:MAG: hypothetical protein ACK5YO_02995, partial [Planctomyces sp.]
VQRMPHERLTQPINANLSGLMTHLLVAPDLAMVLVSAADRIIAQQKTAPHCAIHHVDNRNFICRKDFDASQSCHLGTSINGIKALD